MKLVTLSQLGAVKTYIDTKDTTSIKSGKFENNAVKLYTSVDQTGDPVVSFDLPKEMFLDQAKTSFVQSFAWSEAVYPGSTNPNLDGEPVLVLVVKGDVGVTYSFISLQSMVKIYTSGTTNSADVTVGNDGVIKTDVKVSKTEGNAVTINADGIFVPTAEPTTFSVSASAWEEITSTVVAGRKYSANITDSEATTADFPDVYFNTASIEAAENAGVIADAQSGKIVLYAKSKPTATLEGTYFIKKG